VKAFGSSPSSSSSLSPQSCFFYSGVSRAVASRDRKTLLERDDGIFMIGQRKRDGKGNRPAAAAAAVAESYVSTPSGNDNASPGAAAAAAFDREGLCRLYLFIYFPLVLLLLGN
jgi:hypothetical protein